MNEAAVKKKGPAAGKSRARPRVGFAGLGWIGLSRMRTIAEADLVDIAAIADTDAEALQQGHELAPASRKFSDMSALLSEPLEAIVIATPSAMHAEQAIDVLNAGMAVFCQKPLGINQRQLMQVVEAGRKNDRLVGVDLSYRYIRGAARIRQLVKTGQIGDVYAAQLTFHNAYGPGKEWFYDRRLSGGGCVIDLGIHLVDLAMWVLGRPDVRNVTSSIYSKGQRLGRADTVEDFATARIDTACGKAVDISCSWNLHAGCDAVIKAHFFGTKGALMLENVGGSFFDFVTVRCRGTAREVIDKSGGDDWFGKAAVVWMQRLQRGSRYDSRIEHMMETAKILDMIYQG